MIVEGFFNPFHVIRAFLANEYAFSIFYPKYEIRIAHQKGSWFCVKICGKAIMDVLNVEDGFGDHWAEEDVTDALYSSIKIQHKNLPPTRENEALVIEKTLRIWGGRPGIIEKIVAVQPGRNAIIDSETGEFELSPSEEEFKK